MNLKGFGKQYESYNSESPMSCSRHKFPECFSEGRVHLLLYLFDTFVCPSDRSTLRIDAFDGRPGILNLGFDVAERFAVSVIALIRF